MSADLLAEFGQGHGPVQSSASQSQPPLAQPESLIPDLEQQTKDERFPNANEALLDKSVSSSQGQLPPPAAQKSTDFHVFDLPRHNDSDVLFDAAIDTPASDTEDEWGEFENPEATSQPSQPAHFTPVIQTAKAPISESRSSQNAQLSPIVDLLDSISLKDLPPSISQNPPDASNNKELPQASKPRERAWEDDSFSDWGEFTDGSNSTNRPPATLSSKPKGPNLKTPSQPVSDNDSSNDWDDFTDGPSAAPAPASVSAEGKPNPNLQPLSPTLAPHSFTSGSPAQSAAVRPTNIPPPSVLLELLINILNDLQKEAIKAKGNGMPASTRDLATTIRNTLETAARIIAGRTLRWKRDTILSQSMRIGPATGKVGGMKLSAVNKHEDIKEEQDAVDVLSLWRERAALFNAVTQAAGKRSIPAVPDVGALKVVTARAEQGALKASHVCALCALRRDERLLRIDEGDVQDSFGEWWTEHWGHTGCQRFWESNRHLLGQR